MAVFADEEGDERFLRGKFWVSPVVGKAGVYSP